MRKSNSDVYVSPMAIRQSSFEISMHVVPVSAELMSKHSGQKSRKKNFVKCIEECIH